MIASAVLKHTKLIVTVSVWACAISGAPTLAANHSSVTGNSKQTSASPSSYQPSGAASRSQSVAKPAYDTARTSSQLTSGDVNGALGSLRQAAQKEPGNARVLLDYALALMYSGQDQDAREQLNLASKVKPDSAEIFDVLGQCCLSLGRSEEAEQAFSKALCISPNSPAAGQWRAHIANCEKEILDKQSDPMARGITDYLHLTTRNGAVRWSAHSMPLHVYVEPLKDSRSGANFEFYLKQCLQDWSNSSNKRVTFVLTDQPANAQIICHWSESAPGDAQANEGGETKLQFAGNVLKSVHVTFFTRNARGWPVSDVYFRRVALHQIGHALGLKEHSYDCNDVMFFRVRNVMAGLSERDKNTLTGLYSIGVPTGQNHLGAAEGVPLRATNGQPSATNAEVGALAAKDTTIIAANSSVKLGVPGAESQPKTRFQPAGSFPSSARGGEFTSSGSSIGGAVRTRLPAAAGAETKAGYGKSSLPSSAGSVQASAGNVTASGAGPSNAALTAGSDRAGNWQSGSGAVQANSHRTSTQIGASDLAKNAAQVRPSVLEATKSGTEFRSANVSSGGTDTTSRPTSKPTSSSIEQTAGSSRRAMSPDMNASNLSTAKNKVQSESPSVYATGVQRSTTDSAISLRAGQHSAVSGNGSTPASANGRNNAAIALLPASTALVNGQSKDLLAEGGEQRAAASPARQLLDSASRAMEDMDFSSAISLLEQAQRSAPGPTSMTAIVDCCDKAGNFYWSSGNFNQAESFFKKGVSLAKSGAEAAVVSQISVDYQKFRPAYAAYLSGQGCKLLAHEEFAAAATKFKQSLEFDPECCETLCNYGVALSKAGRSGDAIDTFKRTLQLDPEGPMSGVVKQEIAKLQKGRSL